MRRRGDVGRVWEVRDDERAKPVSRYPTLQRRQQEQEHWNSERVWRPAEPFDHQEEFIRAVDSASYAVTPYRAA